MKQLRCGFVYVSLACLCVAACGDDGGGGGGSTITISPTQGGTLTSDDGRFVLEIPEGAVTEETTVSVTLASVDDLPPAAGITEANLVYALSPEGLTFAVPAQATLTLDPVSETADGFGLPDVRHISGAGTIEPLDELTILMGAGGDATATFPLNGFSWLITRADNTGPTQGRIAGTGPAMSEVGVVFTYDILANMSSVESDLTTYSARSAVYSGTSVQSLTECNHGTRDPIATNTPLSVQPAFVCVETGTSDDVIGCIALVEERGSGAIACQYFCVHHAVQCVASSGLSSVPNTQVSGESVVIMTLQLGNDLYPRSQFNLGGVDACPESHWHSPGMVYPIASVSSPWNIVTNDQNGIPDPAPTVCGHGRESEVPQRPVVATMQEWTDWMTNH